MNVAILSGKGGTGKTTIAAALSELANDVVRIDCDVDAPNLCNSCGKCEPVCRFNAIENFKVNNFACEGCGTCTLVCPQNAISLKDEKVADTFITQLDKGIISRAQMEIGCPVISSITGSDAVLIVTEPTKSGLSDLLRVVDLCKHFGLFTMVCINKYDINEDMSKEIEALTEKQDIVLVGKIP